MNFTVFARNISNITVVICLVKLIQTALRRKLEVEACCRSEPPHCNNYKLMRTFLLRLHNRKPIRLATSVPGQHCGKEKSVYIAGADCRVNVEPETSSEPPVSTSQHADSKVPRTAGIHLYKFHRTAGIHPKQYAYVNSKVHKTAGIHLQTRCHNTKLHSVPCKHKTCCTPYYSFER